MTSFTSYWGSNVHGMEIKWTADNTADVPVLSAEITCNYYWRMHLFHEATPDADLLTSVGGANFGTDLA